MAGANGPERILVDAPSRTLGRSHSFLMIVAKLVVMLSKLERDFTLAAANVVSLLSNAEARPTRVRVGGFLAQWSITHSLV